MSSTRVLELAAVQVYLRDTTAAVVTNAEIQQFLDDNLKLIAKELGLLKQAWSTAAFTLVAATADYQIPTGVQYEQLLRFQRQSDNWPIEKRSADYVESLRTGTATQQGDPQVFYPLENTSQQITVRVWPTPGAAQAGQKYDMLGSTTPVTLSTDGSVVPLSDAAVIALRRRAAADCIEFLPEEQVARLNLDKGVSQAWRAQAAELVRQETLTLIRLKRAARYDWFNVWCG